MHKPVARHHSPLPVSVPETGTLDDVTEFANTLLANMQARLTARYIGETVTGELLQSLWLDIECIEANRRDVFGKIRSLARSLDRIEEIGATR